jgi:hypothetical protein
MASEIKADLSDVQAKLATLVTDAKGQWQAQTNALQSALTVLQTAVKNLAAGPSSTTAAGVRTALGNVNTATRNLLAVADANCPSASP